ncbi:hypothetical protein D3C77_257150 [compost metagenome]
MTPKMQLIARKMERQQQVQAPVPEGYGVGDAIERFITDEVERRVGAALREQAQMLEAARPKPVISDYRDLPPVQRTRAPKNLSSQVFRDGAGLARWIQVGNLKMEILRDASGRATGMRQVDESPVLPALDIPYKTAAREYDPGDSQ